MTTGSAKSAASGAAAPAPSARGISPAVSLLGASLLLVAPTDAAPVAHGQLLVSLTISASCTASTLSPAPPPPHTEVRCTPDSPYRVSLGAEAAASAAPLSSVEGQADLITVTY